MQTTNPPAARTPRLGLAWPLPALLAWALGWAAYGLLLRGAMEPVAAWLLAALLSLVLAWPLRSRWRQTLVALGFPLSSLALGAALPAWAWGLAALALLALYPLRTWRDAPLFPTPAQALVPLATALPLPPGSRVLDAGCGLGHGLHALRRAWPQACIEGVEWSRPMAAWCALRCRFARVHCGDLWALDWSGYVVVYVFQRPETMQRAWAKACAELPAGAWLVSLEFEVPGVPPTLRLDAGGGRPLWLYQVGDAGADRGSTLPRRGR